MNSTPSTWLYPHAIKHAQYTMVWLILYIQFLTHLSFKGIRLLCVFLHPCCFFISLNSFWMASHGFPHDSRFGWFQALLNVLGSSSQAFLNVLGSSYVNFVSSATIAIVAKSIKKFKSFLPFSLEQLTQQFWWHIYIQGLQVFYSLHYFWIKYGHGGRFNFFDDFFFKKFSLASSSFLELLTT